MTDVVQEWTPRYLHRVGDHVSWLDHRIVPDLGSTLGAMMSRSPKGGIIARYKQIVVTVAKEHYESQLRPFKQWTLDQRREKGILTWKETVANATDFHSRLAIDRALDRAENSLKTYPLPKCIHNPTFNPKTYDRKTKLDENGEKPGFQDLNVALYGHGSIKELIGRPLIFIEHISWWFAFLTFDNPLVRGQEMSTRAIWRKNWKMAGDSFGMDTAGGIHARIAQMHHLGLRIAAAEVAAWKAERLAPCEICNGSGWRDQNTFLSRGSANPDPDEQCEPCEGTGRKHPSFDPQSSFRFAFDHARWALPGTIETGVAHAADVRTMARVVQVMEDLAIASGHGPALQILEEVKEAYRQAIPGLGSMWKREAIHDDSYGPGNMRTAAFDWSVNTPSNAERQAEETRVRNEARARLPGNIHFPPWTPDSKSTIHPHTTYVRDSHNDVEVTVHHLGTPQDLERANVFERTSRRQYADPYFNHHAVVDETIYSCIAIARDWHRHRPMMPWQIRIVREEGSFKIDPHYEVMSDFGRDNVDRYMEMCVELHDHFMAEGNQWMAMLCLALGTRVQLKGSAGLQHVLYKNELRGYVAGANWIYKEQARKMLQKITESIVAEGYGQPLALHIDPATDKADTETNHGT